MDSGEGCVAPTAETVADGTYPIARTLYIYVNTASLADNPAVAPFVSFYLQDGLDVAAAEVGYVALGDDAKAESRATWTDAGY